MEEGAHAKQLACQQAEGNHDECDAHGKHDGEQEVGLIGIQPCAHLRHLGQKEEVQEVDVECACADEAEETACPFSFFEPRLIVSEEHHDYQQERIHGGGSGQVDPNLLEGVQLEDVGTADDCQRHDEREEPRSVEEPFCLMPIAANNVAQQEELHVADGLDEAGIGEEGVLVISEDLRQVERLVGKDTCCPACEQQHSFPRRETFSYIAAHIIYNEHLQQHPCEPVASLCRTGKQAHEVVGDVAFHLEDDEESHEHQRRDELHLQLLPCQFQGIGDGPCEAGLVCEETAHEEEERHTHEHQEGQGCTRLLCLMEGDLCHVIGNHQYHRKAPQGIQP